MRNVALIVLYDNEKKILLQHRDDGIERLPGHWAFFGGGIKDGETPEDAVKREAFEELNYNIKNTKLFVTKKFTSGIHHVFVENCINKSPLKLQEGQGMGWYTISETNKLKMADHDREILDSIKDIF